MMSPGAPNRIVAELSSLAGFSAHNMWLFMTWRAEVLDSHLLDFVTNVRTKKGLVGGMVACLTEKEGAKAAAMVTEVGGAAEENVITAIRAAAAAKEADNEGGVVAEVGVAVVSKAEKTVPVAEAGGANVMMTIHAAVAAKEAGRENGYHCRGRRDQRDDDDTCSRSQDNEVGVVAEVGVAVVSKAEKTVPVAEAGGANVMMTIHAAVAAKEAGNTNGEGGLSVVEGQKRPFFNSTCVKLSTAQMDFMTPQDQIRSLVQTIVYLIGERVTLTASSPRFIIRCILDNDRKVVMSPGAPNRIVAELSSLAGFSAHNMWLFMTWREEVLVSHLLDFVTNVRTKKGLVGGMVARLTEKEGAKAAAMVTEVGGAAEVGVAVVSEAEKTVTVAEAGEMNVMKTIHAAATTNEADNEVGVAAKVGVAVVSEAEKTVPVAEAGEANVMTIHAAAAAKELDNEVGVAAEVGVAIVSEAAKTVPVAEAGEANVIMAICAAAAAKQAGNTDGEGSLSVAEGQKHPFFMRLAKRLRHSTKKIMCNPQQHCLAREEGNGDDDEDDDEDTCPKHLRDRTTGFLRRFIETASAEKLQQLIRFWVGWEIPSPGMKVEVVRGEYLRASTCFLTLRVPGHFHTYEGFCDHMECCIATHDTGFGLI
ncbi:hypothetical protein AAFF_G00015430 [Aldrovandia affinis]|uniref:HECT domain-containing protein n=1 Tax=Aldrovandia affinis TaxID=143900 RepID=A0AAD7WHE4_9TELE|nr:hypothetical protein AAFF_G00015430 [Aldrovandia affinis]